MTNTLRVELDNGGQIPAQRLTAFLGTLSQLQAAASLAEFRVAFDAEVDGDRLYTYRFVAIDGREWRQTLRISAAGNVDQTFNVSDYWHLDEFTPHRVVRDAVIDLIVVHGLTLIVIEWGS